MNQCADCKYWNEINKFIHIGECRAHAPTIMLEIIFPNNYKGDEWPEKRWPKTKDTDSCGDFEAK